MALWNRKEKEPRKAEPKKDVIKPNVSSRSGLYLFGLLMFAVGFAIAFAATYWAVGLFVAVLAGVATGCLLAYSIKVAPQWERVVILRMGRFHHIAGPGPYVCIPFVDYASNRVDQRVMASSFTAEEALTSDLVPVDVDAVLFWMVWDAKKACLEVENYPVAVLWSAQTAMRDAIGQLSLGDISLRRKAIDHELEQILGEKCEAWGITVLSVEIRDIAVPQDLQDALSREAQAERERNARVMLAEIEKDISEMYVEAADTYERNGKAMELRAMSLAYESAKEGKGTVLLPSALAEGFVVRAE